MDELQANLEANNLLHFFKSISMPKNLARKKGGQRYLLKWWRPDTSVTCFLPCLWAVLILTRDSSNFFFSLSSFKPSLLISFLKAFSNLSLTNGSTMSSEQMSKLCYIFQYIITFNIFRFVFWVKNGINVRMCILQVNLALGRGSTKFTILDKRTGLQRSTKIQ